MATINTDIATNIDIVVRAEDSFSIQLSILDTASQAFDLTGYKVYMEIFTTSSGDLIKGFTNDTGSPYSDSGSLYNTTAVTLPTPIDGKISIAESATNMDFTKGTYKYSIKLKKSDGSQKTWMYGKLKVNAL